MTSIVEISTFKMKLIILAIPFPVLSKQFPDRRPFMQAFITCRKKRSGWRLGEKDREKKTRTGKRSQIGEPLKICPHPRGALAGGVHTSRTSMFKTRSSALAVYARRKIKERPPPISQTGRGHPNEFLGAKYWLRRPIRPTI